MLVVTDLGCNLHQPRRLKYFGPEGQMLRELIANLPVNGADHTYICQHGHSHRLMVEVQGPEGASAGVRELDSRS